MKTLTVVSGGYLCSPLSVSTSGYICLVEKIPAIVWQETVRFFLHVYREVNFYLS